MTTSAEIPASGEFDVLVVGAGPAGGMAAREAALAGLRVLLVDRAAFPRYKVCGCCLNARALSLLDLHDVYARVVAEGQPLSSFQFHAAGHRTTLALPGGVALSRERFDSILAEAAQSAGALFEDACTARVGAVQQGARRVRLVRGGAETEVRAKVVLICAGLGKDVFENPQDYDSEPTRGAYIGAGALIENHDGRLEPGTIQMAYSRHGYLGAVVVEGNLVNVAAALDPDFARSRGGISNAAAAIFEESGAPMLPGLRDARWRGTPALTRRSARVAVPHAFLLGDTAGYVEPFTGEGIAWALEAGRLVMPLVIQALDGWRPELEREWTKTYRKNISARQRQCRVVCSGLRSYRAVVVLNRLLSVAPGLASPMIHRMNLTATRYSEG